MKRWRIEVEVTFDPLTVDASPEQGYQARERIKAILNRLLEREVEVRHYHLLSSPEYCVEFD